MSSLVHPSADGSTSTEVSLIRFVGYFLRLGAVVFGGPISLAGQR